MERSHPTLIIMAAGMGSRYGGLKQLDPVGPDGEILMDYSVFDALKAGFERVIFVIRKDFAERFDALVKDKYQGKVTIEYAYQELSDLPKAFQVPHERVKPWGTGHAVLAARHLIDGPFCVINADDYYGPRAYREMFRFLTRDQKSERPRIGLCVWKLEDTLSDYGHVSRGVCHTSADGKLHGIHEIKKIEKIENGGRYYSEETQKDVVLAKDTLVSMNFWGFPKGFMDLLEHDFSEFLNDNIKSDPLYSEYLLPVIAGRHIEAGTIDAVTMPVTDPWYGVTNREDRPRVAEALAKLADEGVYPAPLWPK